MKSHLKDQDVSPQGGEDPNEHLNLDPQSPQEVSEKRLPASFIHALKRLEITGNIQPMIDLFSDEAELSNVSHPTPFYGKASLYRFWRDYCALFEQVSTHFDRTIETSESAALEWTTEGTLPSGRHVKYKGVTLLFFQEGKILRFKAFFDPSVFVGHQRQAA